MKWKYIISVFLSAIAIQFASGQAISYSPAINPNTYTINTSLPVGKTSGNLMVGGSAAYSIPIEIPAGTNGLQPSISLNYSSGFSDGIMGIGWSLGGISAITRTNKTIYNDSKSDAIRRDLTDKYALDGKRLVTLSGYTYGADNSVYGTELEEFSKIVAHGATGQGPAYFVVFAKSGLIYEYGNTTDSKLKNGTCILSWKLNKISDRYNNFIRFSYLATDNELPIDKIEYTGNGTTQNPFAQIQFNYKTRADVSSYVFGGKEFTRNILLDNIEVRNNGQLFKKYGVDYMRDTYAQLQKVTEYSSQNIALNPAVFAWTDQTEVFTQTPNYTSSIDELLYTGDFNGDGREDLVTVPVKSSYTSTDKWKLYLADASGNLGTLTTQGDLNTYFEGFLVNDFNGDGLTDLMMREKHPDATYPDKKYYYFYQSTGSSFNRNSSYYICNVGSNAKVVDYNGDGKLEFMYHDGGNWYLYTYTGSLITNASITALDFDLYYINDYKMPTRVLDFNGDGCSDFITLSSSGYKIYEFKGTNNALVQTYSGTNMDNTDFLLFGDYNGDGKIDIIKSDGPLQGSSWSILYLTSSGFQAHTLTAFSNFDIYIWNNQVYAHDMDGDGKTDVVLVGRGTNAGNSYNRINVALSTGSGFNLTEYTSATTMQYTGNFNYGDFDGDGRYQLFYKYYSTSNLFSFASGTPSHLVNNVIDGLGAKATMTYLPMSNSSVYTRGTGASYPVSDFSSSMQLVSQVAADNGIGGTSSVTYKYEGAKIHLQGRGFLGFAKQTTTDVTAGLLTETLSGYNTTYYYPQVNTVTRKTTGGATIETTSNTWASPIVLDASTKRIFPYVSSSTQSNSLTGHSVTISNSSVDNYGNVGQITKSYNNGVTETTMNNYSTWLNTTDWLVGRLGNTSVIYTKAGETAVTRSVRYTYLADGIVNPDFIYFNEGTALVYNKNHDYDAKGNLTQVYTSGASIGASQTNYTYDSNGIHALTLTDALGHTITRTYNSGNDRLLTEKDYLQNTNTYTYDPSDRPYTVLSPAGSQTTTTYVWTGTNKPTLAVYGITQTGNDGSVATTWFDKLGRAIRSEKKGFGGSMILTDTEYNPKGQVYRVSDPYFAGGSVVWAETYTTYDAYGRVTVITRNTGRNTTYSYSSATIIETTSGKSFAKTYGPDGSLTSATDSGGDIIYAYYPDGKVKTIMAPGGALTSMEYNDAARNQTKLTDPSAGTINYTYDSFGRVKTQIDARNKLTTYAYYPDGRINTRVTPEGTTTYTYNTNKQLTGISSPSAVSRTYGYDTKGRVTSISETISGRATPFLTTFAFDTYGRLSTRTHPSGIVETLGYNSYGYMATISAGGSIRYTITGMNARQQLTAATYGSNLAATYGFDAYGYPSSTATGSVQNYNYSFDPVTGNLNWRKNVNRSNITENFIYDSLDRLLTATGPQNLTMTYNANGNINTKSDIGTTAFGYGTLAGPYALTGVTSSTNIIPAVPQNISYNSFGKISSIIEANGSQTIQANFVYNSDNQRARMDVRIYYGAEILTRYYVGSSYMLEVQPNTSNEYTYLGGDAYTAPVVVHNARGVISYYYLLRDYLGNITHQINTSNTLVAEYSFDAWGRRRNATNWTYTLDANDKALFADRGFTGHEYLSYFNLYNMNGRLYDPLVGRFLSADPFVQMPDGTQSYNRYSYCLNNPLKFTDPSGNKWKWPKFEWSYLIPVIGQLDYVMQTINDNTEGVRQKMSDAGIPPFGVGVNVNGAGNVNVNGNINGHEVLNTANKNRSNAGQVVGKEIAQVNAQYGDEWFGIDRGWFDNTIGLTGTITTYVDFGYTINQTLVDIGAPALKFSANTGRVLGSTGYFAAGASTYLDYNDPKVSTYRFSYRTTGTVVGLTVGYLSGYAAVGAIAGGTFWAGEQMYDALDYCKNQYDQFNRDLNNAIRSGWRPGY